MAAPGFDAQLKRFHAAVAEGKPRLGWKVAFNDPATRARFGLDAPPVGCIDAAAFHPSGAEVAIAPGQRVAVEAEVMLTIARDVAAVEPLDALRGAIGGIAAAIELVDYSISSQEIADIVEHSFFHFGTIYGESQVEVPGDAELLVTGVAKNGEHMATSVAARVPADLAEIVRLVAATLEEAGEGLLANDRIICGTYIVPFGVVAGDRVVATYGEGLGEVSVGFV